ncbi:MAG: methyltransferase domain-containing protein [Thermoproteaceae archaeon]|nr:methyltransferase domain-containing protein [Thermoproteaceae archaeon]
MHVAVLDFFMRHVDCREFAGKRVLEVGSKFVNGSVRPLIERFCRPRLYVVVDIEPGRYVNAVLPAERLVDCFGPESFDVVISTETLEHVLDWRAAVNNMKAVLRPGGLIYITTRSRGFPYHAHPRDYWCFEPEDIVRIFGDFEILALERDWEAPGVFLKARKPRDWRPADLSGVALYSVVLGRRVREPAAVNRAPPLRRLGMMLCASRFRHLLPGAVVGAVLRKYCT